MVRAQDVRWESVLFTLTDSEDYLGSPPECTDSASSWTTEYACGTKKFNRVLMWLFSLPDPAPAVTGGPAGGHLFPLPGMPSAPHLVPSRVWSEYKTPEGKMYFYNKITRVSVWEKPKDFDLIMPLPPELGASGLPSHSQQQPSSAPSMLSS